MGVQSVYSTKLKDERYSAECITLLEKVRVLQFVVDTGAKFTCCNFKELDRSMQEEDFEECETKRIGGFIEGASVKFYRCSLRQFTIGTIDMGKQDIWITFDRRVKETVLGMDILQQVIFTANPYDRKICFCKDSDDYHVNFKLQTV